MSIPNAGPAGNEIAPSESVADYLKEGTWSLHQAAEKHPFQRAMLTGAAGRAAYVRQVEQMLIVHTELEAALHAHATDRIGGVYRGYHDRAELIRGDLRLLGGSASAAPTASTQDLVDHIAFRRLTAPDMLLGVLYVLEGSTNGGRFIARAIERGYGLEVCRGTAWLDPHGEEQRPRWKQFRRDISAQPWAEAELAGLVESAEAVFRHAARLMDELSAGATVSA